MFRLSTTRKSLGSAPEKAAVALRNKNLYNVNPAFIECRGLTEFIINCDTTEDELEVFLRECYSDRKTAGAVLKNPDATILLLKEGGMDVYFDKGCEHENLRHAMLSDLCKELGLWEV